MRVTDSLGTPEFFLKISIVSRGYGALEFREALSKSLRKGLIHATEILIRRGRRGSLEPRRPPICGGGGIVRTLKIFSFNQTQKGLLAAFGAS